MVLGTLINHPELLSRDTLYELRNIVARYPYFQTARLLMLNNMYLLHDPDFGAELRRSVLYVSDRRALCRLIEGYVDRVMPEEPELAPEPSIDRTMSLIDAFLGTLPEGHNETLPVADTVGDYATRFLMGADEPSVSSIGMDAASAVLHEDDSVNRALSLMTRQQSGKEEPSSFKVAASSASDKEIVAEPDNGLATDAGKGVAANSDSEAVETPDHVHVASEDVLDESCFTETLAKIYIKQRKYSRALEIIRSLYLQFPEKNAYFADQIRFLEKLIINNNLK